MYAYMKQAEAVATTIELLHIMPNLLIPIQDFGLYPAETGLNTEWGNART